MSQVKGSYNVQNFPPKPVLNRPFTGPKKQGRSTTGATDTDGNGEQPFSSGEPTTVAPATPPKRYVAPAGGPPVDENFRPLPVQ